MSDVVASLNEALEGRYRVERELGEGGMAVVYLADDLRHERKVALKVLRPELAAVVGADRFLTEIKTTANLQHPNILPLFDSGEAGNFLFYVMPYVEGESLRERLDHEHQLPVTDAVRIAISMAEALDYAHRKGVIHRDIKPANVLLLDGKPVISDFGIALAVSAAGGGRLTETGLSMGTPYYMSPEQASADRDPSPASDVYSLGCVLYEMLVGDPPHTASSAQAVLAKILTEAPRAPAAGRASIPAHVDAAIRRAIEKVPADRFPSAADFAKALADPGFSHGVVVGSGAAVVPDPGRWRQAAIGTGALAALLAVVAAWGWMRPIPQAPSGVPTRAPLTGANIAVFARSIAISPDGRWIVATVSQGGRPTLVIREASATEWRPLTNGETAANATFSPRSDWVAYQNGAAGIMKVPVRGGPSLPLGTGARPYWSASDSVLFTRFAGGEILIVGPDGGEPKVVYQPDSVPAIGAHLLPGGRGVLFQTATNPETSRIMLLDRETGEVRQVSPSGTDPRYVEAGYVLFGHPDGGLLAAPFDLRRLEVTGETVPVLPSVQVGAVTQYGVSRNGTLVYLVGGAPGTSGRFVEVTLEGNERPLDHDAGLFYIPRYSPDGSKIAYEAEDEGDTELRLYDVVSGADRQFTSGGGSIAVWAEDGEDLYYTNATAGVGYRRPWDSREAPTRLFSMDAPIWFSDVSHDEGLAIVSRIANNGDLYLARLDADSASLQDFLVTDAWEGLADLSPDGRWVAYVSDLDGELRVYANSFPDLSSPRAISPGFAVDPVWSPDGRTIYYRAGERFYAVDVRTEPTLVVTGAPRELFERTGYLERAGTSYRNWDLHPEGDRLLMLAPASPEESDAPRAFIVTNWFEELRELAGS